jgi:hypothetical protein
MNYRWLMMLVMSVVLLAGMAACIGRVSKESMTEAQPPFSGPANVDYAETLWAALKVARLVGKDAYRSVPYGGLTSIKSLGSHSFEQMTGMGQNSPFAGLASYVRTWGHC